MLRTQKTPSSICKRSSSHELGMSLVELLIAMAVLSVGMLGAMILLVMAMKTNTRTKTDTAAAVLDQEILEKFATLKNYPKPLAVTINDCALSGANAHLASLGQGSAPTGSGATLYTTSTAPTPDKVGDIDWSQPTPTLATATTQGYAMRYQTCSGDIYEVRWNVMEVSPNPNSRISLLTVSSEQIGAIRPGAAAARDPVLFARPTTLRTLIEN
jgi:prepilin-type N-terminal cleavage/methylation domain-containing protein